MGKRSDVGEWIRIMAVILILPTVPFMALWAWGQKKITGRVPSWWTDA
jgi:hypothetical protein